MPAKKLKKIDIHYIKNPGYRQIHADGAYGGITTRSKVNINFYAERKNIPKSEQYTVSDEGGLSEKISTSADSKDGIIREVELGVYMDVEVAKSLISFIQTKIDLLESIKTKR